MTLHELLEICEADVREGRSLKAARAVAAINSAEIPRELMRPFANIARRAGAVPLGLRLLSPLMHRDRNRWLEEATSAELAEYAVLLQNCGAVTEALRVLERVNTREVPEALLYRAFCHFNRWDYAESIPSLEEFLKSNVTPYSLLVGRVNLAAALIASDQRDRAATLLEQNIELATRDGHTRLRGNCLEMRAQLKILTQRFDEASQDLAVASELVGGQTTDFLYVRKWRAVIEALKTGKREPLLAFRAESLASSHWESVREADLHLLKVKHDPAIFDRLIFGTPYLSYRWRVCRYLERMPDKATYLHGDPKGRIFDLSTGELDGKAAVNPGKKIHQLIAVLMRDTYAPMKVGNLFAELFPGDHFDIESSPDRLHQVLRRTRRWLEECDLPIEIKSVDGYYSLAFGRGLGLLVPLGATEVSTPALEFEKLRRLLPEREFTPRQAREKLNLSATGFNSFVNWSLERNLLLRLGKGRAVRYRRVA